MVHGYTNITTTDRRTVTKHYVGPDADVRRVREVTVLLPSQAGCRCRLCSPNPRTA